MTLTVAITSGLVAAAAAAWPYLPKFQASTVLSASDRAGWVNRLFALVSVAEESGDSAVAEAARQLISTLVNPSQPPAKRGR